MRNQQQQQLRYVVFDFAIYCVVARKSLHMKPRMTRLSRKHYNVCDLLRTILATLKEKALKLYACYQL